MQIGSTRYFIHFWKCLQICPILVLVISEVTLTKQGSPDQTAQELLDQDLQRGSINWQM